MPLERQRNSRQRVQERLSKAQDNWIATVEKHGVDLSSPDVVRARKELDQARAEYLSLSKRSANQAEANNSGPS
jgi:hypothetical protein